MTRSYEDDWDRAKTFIPEARMLIAQCLAKYLVLEAPMVEDRERNTDFIVLKSNDIRIACRVRKHYAIQWKHQFTIRSFRASGAKTELAKINEGWGDFFFYGIADDSDTKIEQWTLSDLETFRQWYPEGQNKLSYRLNDDGHSGFVIGSWRDLPDRFIIASSEPR